LLRDVVQALIISLSVSLREQSNKAQSTNTKLKIQK
jgi:hypothetical protein